MDMAKMISNVTLAVAIGAGTLFCSVSRIAAQEEQVLKSRRPVAQNTPGMLPGAAQPNARPGVSASRPQTNAAPRAFPQFPYSAAQPAPPPRQTVFPLASPTPRSRKKTLHRPDAVQPIPSARNPAKARLSPSAQRVETKPRVAATASPAGAASKKAHAKKEHVQESQHARSEHASSANEHKVPVQDQRPPEHTMVVPMRTPPDPAAGAIRLPETTPLPPPAAPPPFAATASQPPSQPPPPPHQPQPVQRSQAPVLNDLSEGERAKLHSAHEAALHDPNLAASRARYLNARKEFREKLRDALLKADPSVQPILEKIRREKPADR